MAELIEFSKRSDNNKWIPVGNTVQLADANGNAVDASNPLTMELRRAGDSVVVTIANGANVSDAFSMEGMAGAGLKMPAAWTAAAIGFYVAEVEAGPYQAFYDDAAASTPIQIGDGTTKPTANLAYSFPAKIYAWPWVKLWSQSGAGVNVNQGGARAFTIVRKS